MDNDTVLNVVFARSQAGREPVREWLKELPTDERKLIGFKIKEVQLGWPIGMPLTRHLEKNLWEVRVSLGETERIARVIFGLDGNKMVLLHGFIKKTEQTPDKDKEIARRRWRTYKV